MTGEPLLGSPPSYTQPAMNIELDPSRRIFEAAAKGANRYAMNCVRVSRKCEEYAKLEATNGRVLVEVEGIIHDEDLYPWPMTELGDSSVEFLLDAAALKAGWKSTGKLTLTCDADMDFTLHHVSVRGVRTSTLIPKIDGEFPNVDAVKVPGNRSQRVAFTVAELVRIAKATGSDVVAFELPSFPSGGQYSSAIRVVPGQGGQGEAILMPVTLDR